MNKPQGPLARRIAALKSEPEKPVKKPAWLDHIKAKEMRHVG